MEKGGVAVEKGEAVKDGVEAGMLGDAEKLEPVEPDLGLEFIVGEDWLGVWLGVGGMPAGVGFPWRTPGGPAGRSTGVRVCRAPHRGRRNRGGRRWICIRGWHPLT